MIQLICLTLRWSDLITPTQAELALSNVRLLPIKVRRCCSTLAWLRAFVNKSASINLVGQYWRSTVSSSTRYRTKWYLTSMCFVRFCITGFLHILIQLWLFSLMTVGPSVTTPISFRSDSRYRSS